MDRDSSRCYLPIQHDSRDVYRDIDRGTYPKSLDKAIPFRPLLGSNNSDGAIRFDSDNSSLTTEVETIKKNSYEIN